MTDEEPIESIPGYSGLTRIGMGGSGVVFRARQQAFDRDVAVKVLRGDFDESARRRFLREARLTGRLTGHPNVVTALDAGTTDSGAPYLAMDLFEHGSLQDRLTASGALPALEVAVIGAKIAAALADAHALGMVHRDVKPNNILVSRFGEPALADFGVAVVPDSATLVTMFRAFTPHHAAPEVLAGADATALSDLYSLGSTLYHLLTGWPPFAGDDDGANLSTLMFRIVNAPPPPLQTPDLPELAEIIMGTLAKDPAERPDGAAELAADLRLLAGAGMRLSGTTITLPPLSSANPTHKAQPAGAGPARPATAAGGPNGTVEDRGSEEVTVQGRGDGPGDGFGREESQGPGAFPTPAVPPQSGPASVPGMGTSQPGTAGLPPHGAPSSGSATAPGLNASQPGPAGPPPHGAPQSGPGAVPGLNASQPRPAAPPLSAAPPTPAARPTPTAPPTPPDPRRSAAGFEAPPDEPVEVPRFGPYTPAPAPAEQQRDTDRRRRPVIIGASAAAAVVVAIGAIALAQGSSSPKNAADTPRTGAPLGPGADDGTDTGQPTDSASRPVGQDVSAGGPAPSMNSAAIPTGGQSPATPGSTAAPGSTPAKPTGAASTSTAQPPPGQPTGTTTAPPPPVTTPPPASTTPSKPPSTSSSSKNMSCTGWHITHVVADDGSGYAASGSFTMRTGPYAACSAVAKFTTGQHMYIWCHVTNGYGNVWVYGRIDGTSSPAWMSLDNFKAGAKLGPAC